MKKLSILLIVIFAGLSAPFLSVAQSTTTVILIRHAEKENNSTDPALSPAGLDRSYKLQKALQGYNPDYFYSTNYKRTQQTITPWVNATNKTITIYNPDSLSALADELKLKKGKTIVVAGHSNTTPQLVNLLLGKEKYASLDDAVYNKIFIITIEGATVIDKVIEY